ncbi:hypothetical protein PR202_ga22226 [Eleusine coracana subsp. coracana]|uniref:Disease resistance N-terminal domain-containing protein n=1 Tax=Eleusine coracana subsp. coracana TaxID=191504 RepID=A0AAV5D2K9_ELECO|nr:hypothetical protein PR202_ga22226 [Eleusine coracana subsp. coracana]
MHMDSRGGAAGAHLTSLRGARSLCAMVLCADVLRRHTGVWLLAMAGHSGVSVEVVGGDVTTVKGSVEAVQTMLLRHGDGSACGPTDRTNIDCLSMASGLVSSLLCSASKLLDLLRIPPAASTPLRGGQYAVSADVRRLQRLLRRIQATLDDAGEREVRDSSVKLWIEELTDLARDAEDVLDDYRYELLRRQAQTAAAVFADSPSTSSGKRTHDGDEDHGLCEQIVVFSTDRATPHLRTDDKDNSISQVELLSTASKAQTMFLAMQFIPKSCKTPEEVAEKLSFRPQHVFVDNCPGMKEWCDEQEFYYQIPKMMKISDVKWAKENGVAYFQSIEHMSLDICPEKVPELILSPNNWLPPELRLLKFGFENSCGIPSFHGALSTLRKLEIRGCPKLVALMDLEELNLLHSLTIADCPLLYMLPEMKFPPLLASLVVEGCHKLLSLHLNIFDPSMFTEIEISDCQGLIHIAGCIIGGPNHPANVRFNNDKTCVVAPHEHAACTAENIAGLHAELSALRPCTMMPLAANAEETVS